MTYFHTNVSKFISNHLRGRPFKTSPYFRGESRGILITDVWQLEGGRGLRNANVSMQFSGVFFLIIANWICFFFVKSFHWILNCCHLKNSVFHKKIIFLYWMKSVIFAITYFRNVNWWNAHGCQQERGGVKICNNLPTSRTWGRKGSKNLEKVVTSFMNGPRVKSQRKLQNFKAKKYP